MSLRKNIINNFLKCSLRIICKVDKIDFSKIPLEGPLIICINHINFIEVPLTHVLLLPRETVGFAKKETWNNPFMAYLFNTFNAIPVDRGGANLSGFKMVHKNLKENKIICIAPEGTRSKDGVLLKGKPGIVAMALLSGAPILPIVHYGGENFWKNLKRFKKTTITYKIGKPFNLKSEKKIDLEIRDKMLENIMYQMSDMLPEHMKGYYSGITKDTNKYLDFFEFKKGL